LLAAIEGRPADSRDAASRSDPAARVPGCPDWSLADLVAHLGEVQRFWATVVMAGPSSGSPPPDAGGSRAFFRRAGDRRQRRAAAGRYGGRLPGRVPDRDRADVRDLAARTSPADARSGRQPGPAS